MLALRPAREDDEPFLFELYCSTRQDELDAWGWAPDRREAFLRLQFRAQQAHYRAQRPPADHQIVYLDGRPIGRLIVVRTPEEMRLADVALLPEHRNAGIGTALIEGVLSEAEREGKPVRLHVLVGNPAERIYARLGFTPVGSDGVHLLMEKQPAGVAQR